MRTPVHCIDCGKPHRMGPRCRSCDTAKRRAVSAETLVERILSRADRSGGPLSCWQWTGGLSRDGYSRIGGELAYLLLFVAISGERPAGFDIDHLCRNRACVNPAHMEWVTRSENNRRSRIARGMAA